LLLTTALSEEQREFAQSIRESGRLLLTIISDVLDFSRMEAGKVELESIPFSPLAVGTHVTTMMAQIARSKGVTLECEFSPELPKVAGDPERLKQVLFNLCSNAIKFTPEGGSVRVTGTASRTDAGLLRLDFSVRDTGIGMTPEAAARVRTFEPFTQADISTTRRFGGTGLGLSICKRLIARMNGDIVVETAVGRGSTFSFYVLLPRSDGSDADIKDCADGAEASSVSAAAQRGPETVSDQTAPSKPSIITAASVGSGRSAGALSSPTHTSAGVGGSTTPAARQPDTSEPPVVVVSRTQARAAAVGSAAAAPPPRTSISHRILCAEDNVVNQRILERFLRRIGFSDFTVVDNGQAAVAAVEAGGYAICLMDCQMPVMDGYDATQRIRALPNPACSRLPIIAVTASTLQTDVERCRASGMDDHLPKPYTMRSLSAALARWLPPPQAASAISTPPPPCGHLRADSTGSATAVATPRSAASYDFSTRSAPTPGSPGRTAANSSSAGLLPSLSLLSHSGSMQPSHSRPLSGRVSPPVTADEGQGPASPSPGRLTSTGTVCKIPVAGAIVPGPSASTQATEHEADAALGVPAHSTVATVLRSAGVPQRAGPAGSLRSIAAPDPIAAAPAADSPHTSRAATNMWRGWCCSTSVAVAARDNPVRNDGTILAADAST
jgi:CheY-like chemotaxis protein